MKFLHTSDWHIGRTLYGRKRYDEFLQFFNWLGETIVTKKIDALLVSGDVFDTTTPSNRAQALYYEFLCRIAASDCRHVVVVGGNHDSPSFLNAPGQLLKALNVHVVGAATGDLKDEVVVLFDREHTPEAVVCAVPYLRDRDIRQVKEKESLDDKHAQLVKGIKEHYEGVFALAEDQRAAIGPVPLIGMGHLFVAGGKTAEGDGVRELHVGSLSRVGVDVFPDGFDYVALGHLHVPQMVKQHTHIRYSGSPIPMGYGEADQSKQVVAVDFDGRHPAVEILPVPCFQVLKRISGNMAQILAGIEALKGRKSRAWLEIEYTGERVAQDLRQQVEAAVQNGQMEIRRIKNRRLADRVMKTGEKEETLEDLDVRDVFNRLLDAHHIIDEDREHLVKTYAEALQTFFEQDVMAG